MYDNEVITDMYEQTEKLAGIDLFVNLNFEQLSEDDQALYVTAAKDYMSIIERLAKKLKINDEPTVMCHEIVFDKEKVFGPYDHQFLKEYPLNITKYIYTPVKRSFLGRRIRELSKWIQIYIPDPHALMTEDMAIEKAVEEVQEYIHEENRSLNAWLESRHAEIERSKS